MRSLIAGMFVALAIAAPQVTAAEKPAVKPAAPAKYSMDSKGRFHTVHKKEAELDCKGCHKKDGSDLLLVSGGAPLPKDSPGPVIRSSCRACHKEGETPAFYGK